MALGMVGALECLQCYVVLPRDGGRDFASIIITLAVADEPLLAQINRTALIVALEEFFGRVQLFGNTLAFAKYCDKQFPTSGFDQVVTDIVNKKGLNQCLIFILRLSPRSTSLLLADFQCCLGHPNRRLKMSSIICDFKAIGAALRKQRIDDWCRRGLSLFDIGESRVLRYAPQGPLAPSVPLILSDKLITHRDAGVKRRVSLCVLTSRIGLYSPITEHVGPTSHARHYRYDVDDVHVVPCSRGRRAAASEARARGRKSGD